MGIQEYRYLERNELGEIIEHVSHIELKGEYYIYTDKETGDELIFACKGYGFKINFVYRSKSPDLLAEKDIIQYFSKPVKIFITKQYFGE